MSRCLRLLLPGLFPSFPIFDLPAPLPCPYLAATAPSIPSVAVTQPAIFEPHLARHLHICFSVYQCLGLKKKSSLEMLRTLTYLMVFYFLNDYWFCLLVTAQYFGVFIVNLMCWKNNSFKKILKRLSPLLTPPLFSLVLFIGMTCFGNFEMI